MALIGVVVIFAETTTAFDSSAKIGLVLLFGVVVNNAILLVARFRTEAELILKAKLGGDPCADAALFHGQHKALGGADLIVLPAGSRPTSVRQWIRRAFTGIPTLYYFSVRTGWLVRGITARVAGLFRRLAAALTGRPRLAS